MATNRGRTQSTEPPDQEGAKVDVGAGKKRSASRASGLSVQIRTLILESDKSRYEIARDSGIAESQLSRFVNGHQTITVETLEKLAAVMGWSIRITR